MAKMIFQPRVARIIDVNINRLTEALKVVEDVVRFGWESKPLLRRVRALRTKVGKELKSLRPQVIEFRASEDDLGRSDRFDRLKRESLEEVLLANCKRAEEAARVLEEVLKMMKGGNWAEFFKEVRFRVYDLEKGLLKMVEKEARQKAR